VAGCVLLNELPTDGRRPFVLRTSAWRRFYLGWARRLAGAYEVPHAKPASDNRAEACSFTGLGSGRRGSALALLLALGATLARRSGAARRQRRVTW